MGEIACFHFVFLQVFEASCVHFCNEQVLIEKRIGPWINKKIMEYIGEEEPALTEFIINNVRTLVVVVFMTPQRPRPEPLCVCECCVVISVERNMSLLLSHSFS